MSYALGVLALLVGLLASIALHELGHLVPAKRFGVRVSKYMVGFGPTLWSRTRGETEYGLKAIPLGGYVRLVGMFAPAHAVDAPRRPGRLGDLVAEAREASAEEIRPGEERRAFYRLSAPKKITVMLGGPLMNLVLVVVLVGVALLGIGLPGAAGTTVTAVGECVIPLDAPAGAGCEGRDPAPAAAAGLQRGDRLVSYGGTPTPTWADFQAAVLAGGDAPAELVVERGGERVALAVDPVVVERPVYDGEGEPVLADDGTHTTALTPFLGIQPAPLLERQEPGDVLPFVGDILGQTAAIVLTLPVRLVEVGQAVFGGTERDPSSVVGVVGIARVAGESASAEIPGTGSAAAVLSLLMVLASLNAALFVFNLIPLLPLDGGHVVGALWEGAKRQVARWRGRPLPRPADMARMMPLAYGVFAVLAVMGVFLIYADIVRPVTFG